MEMRIPSGFELVMLRKRYPKGTKIRLNKMNDSLNPIEPGTVGTVQEVDDGGNIHMIWENSRTLSLIEGVDDFDIIST